MTPITARLWPRLQPLLLAALRLPAEQQPAFVERCCVGEPLLRAHLLRLLAASQNTNFRQLEGGSVMRLGGQPRPMSSLKPAQRLNPYRRNPGDRT